MEEGKDYFKRFFDDIEKDLPLTRAHCYLLVIDDKIIARLDEFRLREKSLAEKFPRYLFRYEIVEVENPRAKLREIHITLFETKEVNLEDPPEKAKWLQNKMSISSQLMQIHKHVSEIAHTPPANLLAVYEIILENILKGEGKLNLRVPVPERLHLTLTNDDWTTLSFLLQKNSNYKIDTINASVLLLKVKS